MNLDQLKRAIKAKTSNKSDMPSWYYRRLSKCISCEFNSGNKDKLSFKDRVRVAHNFGKDACLKCTCGIEDKSYDPIESCPEGFWNSENITTDFLNIYNDNSNIIFKWEDTFKKYTLNYGNIIYKSDSKVVLVITDEDIKNLNVKSSCGCTTANPKKTEKGIEIEVKYDTLRLGGFSKNITITYIKNDVIRQTIINIKGHVNK